MKSAAGHDNNIVSFSGEFGFEMVDSHEDSYAGPILAAMSYSGILAYGDESFEFEFSANIVDAEELVLAEEETAEDNHWLHANVSMMFKTLFNGDNVTVTWETDRTDYKKATSNLRFEFGVGTVIEIEGNGERTEIIEDGDDVFETALTISHNLGAVAVLDEENEKMDIMVNGNDMGDIIELDDGTFKVTFSDGTIETL